MKTILLLGSGELGKEFVISIKRLGHRVIACDSYNNAPAMQVADEREVFDMLDDHVLRTIITKHQPDLIVPEIEAIRTEVLVEFEKKGYTVVPSARAVNLTMNRDRIRDRARELGLRTARFSYAESLQELELASNSIGFPCVIKPVMSSSGKGQSTAHNSEDIAGCWQYAVTGMRGDRQRVIVEEFIDFDFEITLLTVKQHAANTVYCWPIGHHQERGDYQYSWQPQEMTDSALISAKSMAQTITDDLGGAGVFGVEFFIKDDEVIFSELSPRPHDTGMVTLITQNLSEFDLHARAVLGLPIPPVTLRPGASYVVLATEASTDFDIVGIDRALKIASDVRVFGKPSTRPNRRMAVVLADNLELATEAAKLIKVENTQ